MVQELQSEDVESVRPAPGPVRNSPASYRSRGPSGRSLLDEEREHRISNSARFFSPTDLRADPSAVASLRNRLAAGCLRALKRPSQGSQTQPFFLASSSWKTRWDHPHLSPAPCQRKHQLETGRQLHLSAARPACRATGRVETASTTLRQDRWRLRSQQAPSVADLPGEASPKQRRSRYRVQSSLPCAHEQLLRGVSRVYRLSRSSPSPRGFPAPVLERLR